MIIYFKGTSFADVVFGRLDYYVKVENEGGVDIEEIKKTINSVRSYAESILKDEESDKYDEVEMWGAYDYINEAMSRLGYTYDVIDDALISGVSKDEQESPDNVADITIEI